MFESRINQVSDLYSRDFTGKASVSYNGSQAPKETFITDTAPNFRTMVDFGKNVDDDLKTLDRKFERNYNIDKRIYELEKNAENSYMQWKRDQERLNEEKKREKGLKDSLEQLKYEKEQLNEYRREQEKTDLQASNTPSSPYFERRSPPQTQEYFMPRYEEYQEPIVRDNGRNFAESREGFANTMKATNDDFNFHQPEGRKGSSPSKTLHFHDEEVNYKNVDIEKIEAASKHCRACEAKYKLVLNTINPQREKQRITDETIRKLLIQLKALYMSKKFQEAEELVENSLNDGYRHADIYYMAGEIKKSLKLYREAEAYYLQGLSYQVHSPYIYQSLGFTYINLNNHKRAIPLLKHFTDKMTSESALFELGKCLAVCKSYLEATVYFGKAIQLNSKVGDYYLHRGDSYEALGFTKLAIDDYRMFKRLTPNYREIFEKNIKDLEKQKKFEEANSFKSYLAKINV